MAILTNLDVVLGAKTGKFDAGMTRAQGKTKAFAASANGASVALAGIASSAVIAVAGLVTVGATLRFVSNEAASLDNLAKAATRLGITVEKLSALRFTAGQTGVEAATLDMALQRMVRRIAEAAAGTGEAVKALDELGISAQQLNQLSPDEQFARIADAMSKVEKQSDKVRLAMKLFDSEGVALVNTLSLGSSGLEEFEKRAQAAGAVISTDLTKAAEEYNDTMDVSIKKMKAFFRPGAVDAMSFIAATLDLIHNTKELDRALAVEKNNKALDARREKYEAEEKQLKLLKRTYHDISELQGKLDRGGFPASATEEFKNQLAHNKELARDQREQMGITGGASVTGAGAAGGSVLDSFAKALAGHAQGMIGVGSQARRGMFAGGMASVEAGNAERQAQHRRLRESNMLPGAVSGAAGLDQARANRDAKSIADPQLKATNLVVDAAKEGNSILERMEQVLIEKLSSVTLAR